MILQWILTLSLGLWVNAVPPMRLSHSGYEVISFAGQKREDTESLKIPRNFQKSSGFKVLGIAKPSDELESYVPRQDRKIHYESGRSNPKQNTVESPSKDQMNLSSYPTKFAFRTSDQDPSDTLPNIHPDKLSGIAQSKSNDPKNQNPLIKNDTEKTETNQDPDFEYTDIRTEDVRQEKPLTLPEEPSQDDKEKQERPELPKQSLPTIMKFLPGPRGFLTLQKSTNLISPIYPAGYDISSHRSAYKTIPFGTFPQSKSQDDSSTRHKYSSMIQEDFEPPREILRQSTARDKTNSKYMLLNSLKHFLLRNKMSLPRTLMGPPMLSFAKSIPITASHPGQYYPSISSLELRPMSLVTSPMELSVSRRIQHRNGDSDTNNISGPNNISKGSLIIDIVHEITSDDLETPAESKSDRDIKERATKNPCPMKGKNEFYDFLAKFSSNVMETAIRYEASIRADLASNDLITLRRSMQSRNALKQAQ